MRNVWGLVYRTAAAELGPGPVRLHAGRSGRSPGGTVDLVFLLGSGDVSQCPPLLTLPLHAPATLTFAHTRAHVEDTTHRAVSTPD